MAKKRKDKVKSTSRRSLTRKGKLIVALTLAAVLPLVLLNGAVAVAGQTVIFPLSTAHLGDKWAALKAFARHFPKCILSGHARDLSLLIQQAEVRHNLPTGLLAALIHVESSGRVHRISPTGAMGPGQLMPETAKMLKVSDPFDPPEAIDASARYLSRQLIRFQDVRLALAAYNAGPGSVLRRRDVPINGETEHYVKKVLREFERRKAVEPPPPPLKTPSDMAQQAKK